MTQDCDLKTLLPWRCLASKVYVFVCVAATNKENLVTKMETSPAIDGIQNVLRGHILFFPV